MLLTMGWIFGRTTRNSSDYFRGGQRGTWWLVGVSMLMAGVSARTFTANSGVAYEAGFSFFLIYLVQVIAMPIEYGLLASRFRRLRATTTPEIVRERFGAATEQFAAYLRLVTTLVVAAAWLWGLAIFVGSAFGYNINTLIVTLGIVVIIYATAGGSWAVMGNDFIQGLIMISMCILLAILAYLKIGGISGLFALIEEQNLIGEFAVFKDPDISATKDYPAGYYTWPWAATILITGIMWNMSMGTAEKYFAVKDEKHAKRLALLVGVSTAVLMFIFFLPNAVSRLMYTTEVNEMAIQAGLSKAAEGSFAVASLQLLPESMVIVMVIAMFAASLSSLDTGMNRNAALFVKNVLPPLRRFAGAGKLSDIQELWIGKVMSVIFGIMIILISLYMAKSDGVGMFETLLSINSLLSFPLVIPMALGLFIKKGPKYAAIVSIIFGFIPGVYSFYLSHIGEAWTWVEKSWWIIGWTVLGYLISLPFSYLNSNEYNTQVEGFFKKMRTPIDFDKEVGESNDGFQMKILGSFSCVLACFVLLLNFIPGNDSKAHLCICSVSFIILLVGVPLYLGGKRRMQQL